MTIAVGKAKRREAQKPAGAGVYGVMHQSQRMMEDPLRRWGSEKLEEKRKKIVAHTKAQDCAKTLGSGETKTQT